MKAIFRRELRRLAPYGAGAIGLAFASSLLPFIGVDAEKALISAQLFGVVLLGVATVAPDTSSGAIAFLARMPLSRNRVLAAKLAAALIWSAAVAVLPELILEGKLVDASGAGAFAFAFAAGSLASVMTARTLPAVAVAGIVGLTAPLLVAAPAFLLLDAGGFGSRGIASAAAAFAASFLAIAFFAFGRGDRHRATWRPALLAVAGVILLDIAAFSGVALAHGWHVSDSARWLTVDVLDRAPAAVSRDGRFVAVSLRGSTWAATEERVALVDREKRTARLLPPRGATVAEFSPGGALLLPGYRGPGGWLVRAGLDRAERIEAAWDGPLYGFGTEVVLWRDEQPFFPRVTEKTIEVHAPGGAMAASRPRPAGAEIAGVSSGRIVLLAARGLELLDPWTGGTQSVELEGVSRAVEAAISPSGRRALVLASLGKSATVFAVDLSSGRSVELHDVAAFAGKLSLASFSPDETRVVLAGLESVTFLDLDRGTRLAGDPGPRPHARRSLLRRPVWSPDGRAVALSWGPIVDAATGAATAMGCGPPLVAFVAPDVAVSAFTTLSFVEPVSGDVVARPLEGR